MSQAVITKAFTEWKAQQAINNQPVTLDEFIFAYIPGLDADKPIDNTETTPAADKIVYRQAVSKSGVVNENSVVYSVTLGADVGDFDFNWIGLANKATGTLAMIIHAPTQRKIKNANGQQGNVLVRSMLMEYSGAREATEITTPAETWQIDFTARLAAMDERQRRENIDLYGAAAFFDSGYLVAKTGNQFFVTKGAGYVAGLRAELPANLNITASAKPTKVWLDVSWTGTLTSEWAVQSKITVAADLANYVQGGVQHYVFAVASIDAAGNITDLRPKGTLNDQAASDALSKHEKSRNHPDASTTEKGFVQLSSATDSNSEKLAATPKAVKAANDNANGRVPSGRKVNGKALTGDISITSQDIFDGQVVVIGENQNLDSYQTPGLYAQDANVNTSAALNYPENNAGSLMVLKSAGVTQVYRTYNSSRIWSRSKYSTGGWTTWAREYNTQNKPGAGDVGALPITGGTINGALGIGTANGLGGHSIVLGDSDTGFKQEGDGILNVYANSALVMRFISSIVESLKPLKVNGNCIATGELQAGNGAVRLAADGNVYGTMWGGWLRDYLIATFQPKGSFTPAGQAYTKAESDARYVQNIRVSAPQERKFWDGAGWSSNDSAFATSIWMVGGSSNVGGLYVRYVQKNINGTWINVTA
jgi:hypothetical protein